MNQGLWKHSTSQTDKAEQKLCSARRHQKFKRNVCDLGLLGVLTIKIDYKSNLFPKRNTLNLLFMDQLQKIRHANLKIF